MSLIESIIIKGCSLFKINLLATAYKGIGIAPQYQDLNEVFFKMILPRYIKQEGNLVFFDVGANVGDVTRLMIDAFNNVTIHSFEPNPNTFKKLAERVNNRCVILNNLGLGERPSETAIFYYSNDTSTGHASIYKDVFKLHKVGDDFISQSAIQITTLDQYAMKNNISQIDFIKIDTEGNDYNVLKGARDFLSEKKIKIIQFEFNEMNIISRVFLKDFYDLLKDYDLYRIKGRKLFPLGVYSSENEIFRLQNMLAILK
jgi:FkbM family methyltransferase